MCQTSASRSSVVATWQGIIEPEQCADLNEKAGSEDPAFCISKRRGERFDDEEGYQDALHAEEEDLEESLAYSERQQSEDVHDYALDDPRSLLMLIRELAPEVEKAIKALLRNEHSSWEGIISKFASELVMQAKEKNDASDEYAEVDDMFSFLD